ncbi:hypothetical protein IQ266_08765 [filamentous cyanobacterium LEGE 11480]|uniref:Uncharacterized protein n=1 Tax=Romeriopsis navalis LEGE 11480 TaxID=2777977 RepID=A0A928VJK8_9CYAN|nr:hypothetical protein [Romeriopsis navalis]MBE9029818.1 hypothetical protein [Romeriopsis navalis LEGE 11480]
MFEKRRYRPLLCSGFFLGSIIFCTAPVLAVPNITASAAPGATALPLGDSGGSPVIQKAADVQVSTVDPNGLTLSILPGSLTKTDGAPIALQFLAVANGAAIPNASAFVTDSSSTYTFATSGAGTDNLDLYIKYTPAALQDPGNYNLTIQLSVADNP